MGKFIIGDILTEKDSGKQYRIISFWNNLYILIDMKATRIIISAKTEEEIINDITATRANITSDNSKIIDIENLAPDIKEEFYKKKILMQKVIDIYGPSYIGINDKKSKPELQKLYTDAGYPRNTFWRIVRKYMQQGMRDNVLIYRPDRSYEKNKCVKNKLGRKCKYVQVGKARTEEDFMAMDKAIAYYLSGGKEITITNAYDWLNLNYYSNGNGVLMPATMRLSKKQFSNYLHSKVSKEQIAKAKKGTREVRNNNRVLLSDTLYGNDGPGDVCEIDACEIDFSSVGIIDRTKSPGRPTAYFLIDVYSKCIVGVAVGYEVNSEIGVINLLMNLADDKIEFCRKYGIDIKDEAYFPSGFIPRIILDDRGSDFISNQFKETCRQLGITTKPVSSGMGSFKGNIEQSFRQFMLQLRPNYVGKGLITGEYGNKPHGEAVSSIDDFMKHIIVFALTYNNRYNTSYELSVEQMSDGVRPIPIELWKYGCEHKNAPRPLTDPKQFYYSLLKPAKAVISRDGIFVHDTKLYYINNQDTDLYKELFNAQQTKIKFDCRYDVRDITRLYYVRNHMLYCAILNQTKHANIGADKITYTERIAQLEAYKKIKAQGIIDNENTRACAYMANDIIVKNAEAETCEALKDKNKIKIDDKNICENRLIEKEEQKKQNTITMRLENEGVTAVLPELVKPEPEPVRQEQDDDIEFDFDALADDAFYKMVGYENERK